METVTINITRANLIADMRVKSHAEVSVLPDPQERFRAELGTEKLQEANQCITDAATEIHSVLRTFLTGFSGAETATDSYDTTATISYTFSVTERKAPGLADTLTKAIHAYIVDSALEKYYSSVSRVDFAERHRAQLPSEITVINNLLYRRKNPTYTRP
jgi:hypothetical protein